MDVADAVNVAGEKNAAATELAAAAPAGAVAPAAAVVAEAPAGTTEPQRRRPKVAFHVTGFGVFNGVADNPTTHLIKELPGQLKDRPSRPRRYDDYKGHDRHGSLDEQGGGAARRGASESLAGQTAATGAAAAPPLLPAFGGDGDGAFEVRSCEVLHVSAEVGGRQLRELHAASSGSSDGSERPAAAPGPTAAVSAAVTACGGSSSSAGVVVGPGDGGGGVGGGTSGVVEGKSADEGGGPGDSGSAADRVAEASDGGNRAVGGSMANGERGSAANNNDNGGDDGGDNGGDDDNNGDDDIITIFVHCGVNGGTDKFALETRGFNEADFRVPDEQGYCPSLAPIEPGLPKEHCRATTLPVADVLERLGALGWGPEDVAESRDAGRFVCNYVYYTSLGLCEAPPAGPAAAAVVAAEEGGRSRPAGASEDGQRGEGTGVFCFSGAGAGGGVGGSGGRDRGTATSRRRRQRRRHSLFIHVPPFEVVPKEKQLALLVACLSTIAAAVASTPSTPPPAAAAGDDEAVALEKFPFVAAASTPASAAANGAAPVPPLSLSTYEAAVLAAGPEALSPDPVERPPAPAPVAEEDILPVEEQAAPSTVPSIWDGAESAEVSPRPAAEEDEAADRGDGGGARAHRVVHFALAGLAENEEGGRSSGDGSGYGDGYGDGGEGIYYRGEIGGDSGSEAGEAGDADEEFGEGETPADATRRRLIAAGFDSLDVDAAMATTGSDDTEVNMGFLLDITPLLPRGAPSEADGLNLRECISSLDQHGNGDRGRGATATAAADHTPRGGGGGSSNGGGAIRPRLRPAASPAGMGGVSPKWVADVSPVRDDSTPRSGGGGGLLRRLRRGHKRVPSAASATSEGTNDGEGERSSEQRALSSSSPAAAAAPRQRSPFTSLSSSPVHQHQQRVEYTRRTTGHAARSHSPPPLRGGTGAGTGGRLSRREFGSGGCVPRVAAGWGELAPSSPNLRLALVVRLDLGMAPGTVAAQCSRAALAATRKAEGGGRADTLAVWRDTGESIVVLGAANARSLDAVIAVGEASHLPITMVRDKQAAWVGNVRADTCTVAAIGPAPMSVLRSVAGGLTVL